MATSYHVSDILQQHLAHYQQQHKLTEQQALLCQHIQQCRTQALGIQQWRCDTSRMNSRCFATVVTGIALVVREGRHWRSLA